MAPVLFNKFFEDLGGVLSSVDHLLFGGDKKLFRRIEADYDFNLLIE